MMMISLTTVSSQSIAVVLTDNRKSEKITKYHVQRRGRIKQTQKLRQT